MNTLDPWVNNMNINILNILNKTTRVNINVYGPLNKNNVREYMNFIFYKNNNNIIISSNEDCDIRVNIDLNDNSAIINHIENFTKNRIEIYSGTDIMKLLLKLLKILKIKKVSLIDQSKKICKNRSNKLKHIFSNTLSYSVITLLKNNKTFYMKFGFKPYLRDDNKTNNLINILQELKTITWNDIYAIIQNGNITINYIKNGNLNIINSNIRNINTWILYWNMIEKSFNYLYTKYKDIYIGPFDAFERYNNEECHMFVNWLELYSLSKFYEKISYEFYNENKIKKIFIIPYKDQFIKLLYIIKSSVWIIDNLEINSSNINIDTL